MGRKAGGKNFGNFTEEGKRPIEVTEDERDALPKIFTHFNKDIITINDFMNDSGLSYDTCAKIIREIKSVSDILCIAGCVHRTDYYVFINRRFEYEKAVAGN